jgi:hypothetical protein
VDAECIPPAETVEAFEDCLDSADTVAVVAAPWSGRAALLERAGEREGATERLSLDEAADESPTFPDTERALVADCHRLFRRKIDGFDRVEALARAVAGTDVAVVTGWNATAWSYLDATTEIAAAFDEVFEVPPLGADQAETLLFETTDTNDPETELAAYAEYAPDHEFSLGYARTKLRRLYRGAVLDHLEGLVEDAAGNPRTLHSLFECRTERGVDGRPGTPDVAYSASYLLWLVLANEGLGVEELADLGGQPVQTEFAPLAQQGVVRVTADGVTIPAAVFGDVRSHLDAGQLLW